MIAKRTLVLTVAVALAALAAGRMAHAQGALPSDLSGTWVGKVSCKANDAATGASVPLKAKDLELHLRLLNPGTNGAQYAARFDDLDYSARSIDVGGTGSGKGVLALVLCGSNDDTRAGEAELWKLSFKVDPAKGTGKLSGELHFADTDTGTADVTDGVSGQCTTSWKRISMDDGNDAAECN